MRYLVKEDIPLVLEMMTLVKAYFQDTKNQIF
jgi:hypothetical protein